MSKQNAISEEYIMVKSSFTYNGQEMSATYIVNDDLIYITPKVEWTPELNRLANESLIEEVKHGTIHRITRVKDAEKFIESQTMV